MEIIVTCAAKVAVGGGEGVGEGGRERGKEGGMERWERRREGEREGQREGGESVCNFTGLYRECIIVICFIVTCVHFMYAHAGIRSESIHYTTHVLVM